MLARASVFAFLLVSTTAVMCQSLPNAPSACDIDISDHTVLYKHLRPIYRPPVADKKFMLVTAYTWAATILDIESTRHAIEVCGLTEANPIYGKNPSRKRLYAINVPLSGANTLIAYLNKKRSPYKRRRWMLPLVVLSATHTGGWINNYARCH